MSAAQYFEQDIGLHSVDRILRLNSQVSRISGLKPIIADIDDSFGDYTLAGHYGKILSKAGIFGVVIEDQARPRKCGHLSGKHLNPVHKYSDGIRRLRDSCPDLFIVGRTDAESPSDLSERIELLVKLSLEGACNAIQVDGIRTLQEISSISSMLPTSTLFVANHVDGGKLQSCNLSALSENGVDILTLSSFLLSNYIDTLQYSFASLSTDRLPTGRTSLSELMEILRRSENS